MTISLTVSTGGIVDGQVADASDVLTPISQLKTHLENALNGIQEFESIDVNGGSIDGAVIGGASPATGNFTGLEATSLRVNNGGSGSTINLDGSSGTFRNILYRTGTSNRWVMQTNSAAESGGDVGSDFLIGRYDDSGNYIETALTIFRSNGLVDIAKVARTGGLRVDADPGGLASTLTLTHTTDTPTASLSWGGVGTPNGYIKAYIGTQAIVIPYWNT
ncbi:MAG: hypothetical protein K8L99_20735 [Anaerolineae bacterium]|nr:hypothetical protein [Anaerolineae bacterium]